MAAEINKTSCSLVYMEKYFQPSSSWVKALSGTHLSLSGGHVAGEALLLGRGRENLDGGVTAENYFKERMWVPRQKRKRKRVPDKGHRPGRRKLCAYLEIVKMIPF